MPYPDLPGQSASLPLGWDCKLESLQDKERAGEEGKPKSQTEDTRILSRWAGTVNLKAYKVKSAQAKKASQRHRPKTRVAFRPVGLGL